MTKLETMSPTMSIAMTVALMMMMIAATSLSATRQANAFAPSIQQSSLRWQHSHSQQQRWRLPSSSPSPSFAALHAKDKKQSDDDESTPDAKSAMEEAFAKLDDMKSLGDGDAPGATINDADFAKAMKDLDLSKLMSEGEAGAEKTAQDERQPEKELKIYEDMVSEIETGDFNDVKDSVKSKLMDSSGKGFGKKSISVNLDDIPAFDPTESGVGSDSAATDAFMNKALDQAFDEANAQGGEMGVNKESFMQDESFKEEIEDIFTKANAKLVESLEEIRADQKLFAEKSALEAEQRSIERSATNEERIAIAEDNMRKVLDRVNDESKAVEGAIEDLKRAQEEASGDETLTDLRSGGIVKQAALVGTLLFTVRGLGETVAFTTGMGESHLIPAIVQSVLAVVCIIILKFL